MKITILLAEDSELIRRGLRMLIEDENDMTVVGEAATGPQAVEQANALNPQVVVMDFYLPFLRGDDATRQILAIRPRTGVVGYSAHADEAEAAMLAAGAVEVLDKGNNPDAILHAIRRAAH